jgi:predicted component of type VI protein secretion system
MAKLIVHAPDRSMRDVRLDRERLTIGRRADNDLCLPYPAVSADHAAIITIHDDSFLEDVGSTNGTLVNGNRITKHFLRDHDQIEIGRQHLVYLANEAETVDPLAPDIVSHEAYSLTERVASVPPLLSDSATSGPAADAGSASAHDPASAPVDDLLKALEEVPSEAPVLEEVPPVQNGAASVPVEAVIKVLTGPNAGQTTAMTKPQFVFGKLGVQIAAIRRDGGDYRLVPLNGPQPPVVNGNTVAREGATLAFGDTIDVAGVQLRFERPA